MIAKVIKLVFLNYLLFVSASPAQNLPALGRHSLVLNYNNWLKSVKLNSFVSAVKLTDTMANGIKFKMLVLNPSKQYDNPLELASAWPSVRDHLMDHDVDIYQLLLSKLADYTGLSIKSVLINIQSNHPEMFSVKVYYDKQLETDEQIISTREGGDIGFNPDATLRDIVYGRYRLTNSGSADCRTYYSRLIPFLQGFKHGNGGVVFAPDIYTKDAVTVMISNLQGQITRDYHEVYKLEIKFDAHKNNTVDLVYGMNLYYAAGVLAKPVFPDDYREVIDDFPLESLVGFNNKFYAKLWNIIYP